MNNKVCQLAMLSTLFSTYSMAENGDMREVNENKFVEKASTASLAYPHLFIGAKTGYPFSTPDNMSKRMIAGAFVGVQFTDHWSWDVGYQSHGNVGNSQQSVDIGIVDTAIRYDWHLTQNASLYSKLGAAYWDISGFDSEQMAIDEKGISPMGEIGFNYRITPHIYFNTGFQHVADVGKKSAYSYNSNALMLGLSYHFVDGKDNGKSNSDEPMHSFPIQAEPVPKTIIEEKVPEPSMIIVEKKPAPSTVAVVKKPETEPESMMQVNVTFNSNSSILALDSGTRAELDQFIHMLNKHPDAECVISGHTDSVGDIPYNNWLAERRARSVLQFLKEKGVNENRLSIRALGEMEPLASNISDEGRAKNRRVELNVLPLHSVDKS